MVVDQIQDDLKQAMLARDSLKVDVLKGLKSAFLYQEVESGVRDTGLSEDEALKVLKRESKKRQDSADLYEKGGDSDRRDKELQEKEIIDAYLPEQLSEDDTKKLIDEAIEEMNLSELSMKDMGRIIGAVQAKGQGNTDGSLVARLVKERIS